MPLLGQHSQNPNGNPELLAQFGSLTPEQLAIIARGGSVNLGKGLVNFSDGKPERAAELAAAKALIAGNSQQFGQIADRAAATHKDWTGGTLAKLAPAAAAFIPGVGPLAAAGLGAVVGGATRAAGLDRGSIAGGALQGGAIAGGTALAKQAIGRMGQGGASGAAEGAAGSGGGILDQAKRLLGGQGGLAGALQTGMGVLGAVQGAQRQGQANDLRTQGLASLQPGMRPDMSSVYADAGNPYARPAVPQTALASARSSLRGY